MSERETAVIFGAGSVGRGFLGQLFSESGYAVVFVDIDQQLIEALSRQGAYRLQLAGLASMGEVAIRPVCAISGLDKERVADAVATASLAATAVGVRALAAIADAIAAGLERRWQAGRSAPFNLILCENSRAAPQTLRDAVREALPQHLRKHLDERVGFVPAVVARMSPVPTAEQRVADPTLIVAEPYKVLPVDRNAFVGAIPSIVGMEPVSPFDAYVDRKLYIHNAGHSMLGYLGYLRGYQYGYEAIADPVVLALLQRALSEASSALIAEHGLDAKALRDHVLDLLARFTNRTLADPISRLARDPLRKLAPGDRLVGAARLSEKHGIAPNGLAWGIAAGLAYDEGTDGHAVELQTRLAQQGLRAVLDDVCGIDIDESLGGLVRAHYGTLCANAYWQRRVSPSGSPRRPAG